MLKKDEVLFKAIEEEKTRIKAEHKPFANFALTKSNTKPQERVFKGKKEFVKWPKCKKYGCKYLANQAYKYANKMCEKYDKNRHISCFYDSYTFLNKEKTLDESTPSSSDSKKHVSCVTQIVANTMFEIRVT